jgi:3'(2'), 5'-bisphosphate nucleotidase
MCSHAFALASSVVASTSTPVSSALNHPAHSSSRASCFALRAARASVAICLHATAKPSRAAEKSDGTPVTAADFAAQARVASLMQDMLPLDSLVAEETLAGFDQLPSAIRDDVCVFAQMPLHAVRNAIAFCQRENRDTGSASDGGRLWTLDPIDGSLGLILGSGYSVGIARLPTAAHLIPDVAALALPHRHCILLANEDGLRVHPISLQGDSAIVNDRGCDKERRWHFSPASKAVALPGLPPATSLCCGSLIKYGEVALGYADALVQAMPSGRAHVWDHAAGIATVVAAGGQVTDLRLGGNGQVLFDDCFVTIDNTKGPGGIVASGCGVDHDKYCNAARRVL